MSFWRTLWYLLITALAITAMGFAIAVTYTPDLLPAGIGVFVQTVTEQFEPRTILMWVGLIVALGGILGLGVWRIRGLGTTFFDPDVEKSNRDVPVAGHDLKEGFDFSDEPKLYVPGHPTAGEDMRERVSWDSSADAGLSEDSVKEALRGVLREAYRMDFDDRSDVDAYLDRGEWTTDRYAAAFISSSRERNYPLRHRIFAWLYPERAKAARVERSLQAVESVAGDRLLLYEAKVTRQPSGIERLKAVFNGVRGSGERE